MFLELLVTLWTLLSSLTEGSLVIDKQAQDGIYLSQYCPKMPFCAEGSHVMCMYYNPNHVAGPRCSNFQNVSISSEVADKLLDLVNEMRGQIAMGKETGKGNVTLPRGYGLYKLVRKGQSIVEFKYSTYKWDNELATFAQVLANTCVLRHDLCRATHKFEDPGQLASLVRFTIPDWFPVLHRQLFVERGLTPAKIEYAAKEAYKSWYQSKQFVTADMVKNLPDWLSQPSRTQGRLFLQLIDGKATHMGCGLSAYVEYGYQGKKVEEIIFNSIHIICNFSSQPRKHTNVYNVTPPIPSTDQCGCPPGTEVDDRCLCSDYQRPDLRTCSKGSSCKPAVVLLPIFTVEDAPPPKVPANIPVFSPVSPKTASEGVRRYDTYGYRRENPRYPDSYSQNSPFSPIHNDLYQQQPAFAPDPYRAVPSPAEFYSGEKTINRQNQGNRKPYRSEPQSPKRPIFGHILPKRKTQAKPVFPNYPSIQRRQTKPKRPDVAPRKDFSKAQQLLNTYLNEKRNRDNQNEVSIIKTPKIPSAPISPSVLNTPALIEKPHDVPNTPVLPEKIPDVLNMPNVASLPDKPYSQSIPDKPYSQSIPDKPYSQSIPLNEHNDIILQQSMYPNETVINSPYLPNNPYIQNAPQQVDRNSLLTQKKKKNRNQIILNPISGHESDYFEVKNINDVGDKKFMTLLDTLEQEVKHIELNVNEKEIVDAKIRKIYGTVVGKHPNTLKKQFSDTDTTVTENENESIWSEFDDLTKRFAERQISETEDKINLLHPSDSYVNSYPRQKKKSRYDQRNNVNSVSNHLDIPRNDVDDYSRVALKNKNHITDDRSYKKRYQPSKAKLGHYKGPGNDVTRYDSDFPSKRQNVAIRPYKPDRNKIEYDYYDDPLDPDRRKFYEDRLGHLERKLHNEHKHHGPGHKKEHKMDRVDRLDESRRQRPPARPSKRNLNPLNMYMTPDRGRYIHGY